MYVIDNIISETDKENDIFVKPSTMSPLQLANELCLKFLSRLHVYEEHVLKTIVAEGLLHFLRRSMRAYWSIHKTSRLQKLVYNATLLTVMQSAARAGKQPTVYTINRYKSYYPQASCRRETNNNTRSSSNTSPRQSHSGKSWHLHCTRCRCRIINQLHHNSCQYAVNRLLWKCSVLYGGLSTVAKSIASKCLLIPLQLRTKFTQDWAENLETLARCI